MTTQSVSQLSDLLDTVDGLVVGPAWTEERCREVLRSLRLVEAASPDDLEGPERPSDVCVAARVFHEVLTLHPASTSWPVFAGCSSRSSLFKAAFTHAHAAGEVAALARLSDESALLATNVARWLMQLPRQASPTVVFSHPPRRSHPVRFSPPRPAAVAC